jgi:hypothetical protein
VKITVVLDATSCNKVTYVSKERAVSNFIAEKYPEDGSRTFLRNMGDSIPDYTASHPMRR